MSLIPNSKEVEYHRNNFYEALELYGVNAIYKSITGTPKEAYDFYDDIEVTKSSTYAPGIPVRVTFEEVPTVKTLRSFGWYTRSDENVPMLAYLPIQYKGSDVRPRKDDILEISANGFPSRSFLVKDFKGRGFPDVIYWACKLVQLDVDNL